MMVVVNGVAFHGVIIGICNICFVVDDDGGVVVVGGYILQPNK